MKWALVMVGALVGAIADALLNKPPLDNDPDLWPPERFEATKLTRIPDPIYPPGRADLIDLVDERVSIAGEPDEVYQNRPNDPSLYYIHVPPFDGPRGPVSEAWWVVSAAELMV